MKPDEFVDSNQPDTDQILYYLTSAARSMLKDVDSMYGPEAKQDITYIYNWLRGDLKEGNFAEFEKSYDMALRKYPDAASELYDVMYEHAGLGMHGTYEEFMAKCTDNGVSEGLDKHSFLGKIKRKHELKGKVDSTFKDIGDAQKKGDHPAASNAFRKHERYANLERPGTWTKVKEESNPTDTITMDVPLVIRLMEYAKEDAQDDMALHKVAEQLTSMSQGGKTLTMADYDNIVGGQVDETIVKTGGQYELKSHTGKNLGKYPTKAGAEKREKQVNYFKHVKEGSDTEADIDKKIEFHKQGQASAQYKGSMNKMHAAKIRELEAKLAALKKQPVKEDASCGATSAGAFATGAVGAAKPKKIIKRKSAVGEGIDQVEEFKAPDDHPFNKKSDAELKGFVKDAPEAAASIKKRGGNPAKIEKDAVTANVIKQSRQNDPRK